MNYHRYMATMKAWLGLGEGQQTAGDRGITTVVVVAVLALTYGLLDRPWWQELLISMAGAVVAGGVIGLWQSRNGHAVSGEQP